MRSVNQSLGKHARPHKVVIVQALPRTRSGKVLRRLIQAAMADLESRTSSNDDIAAVINALASVPDVAAMPLHRTLIGNALPSCASLSS
jgi:propionyl-CoA synthetase